VLQDAGQAMPWPDSLLFFFWTHSLVNQGWGGFYIDRARVLELRFLARHVAPRWRDGALENAIAFNGRTKN
jgi:hypothetical protein